MKVGRDAHIPPKMFDLLFFGAHWQAALHDILIFYKHVNLMLTKNFLKKTNFA